MIKKRNWTIELLRFVFACFVVAFHFNATRETRIWLGYHCNIGVEFFCCSFRLLISKKRFCSVMILIAQVRWLFKKSNRFTGYVL